MNYDAWKTRTPDHEQPCGSEPERPWPTCRDCGQPEGEHMHHCPTGSYCHLCWELRRARGWHFDARTLAQLKAEAA